MGLPPVGRLRRGLAFAAAVSLYVPMPYVRLGVWLLELRQALDDTAKECDYRLIFVGPQEFGEMLTAPEPDRSFAK